VRRHSEDSLDTKSQKKRKTIKSKGGGISLVVGLYNEKLGCLSLQNPGTAEDTPWSNKI